MGLKVGELFATIGLDSGGFDKGLAGAERSMASAAKNMSSAGLKLTLGLTVPLVALGKSVFGAAMEWESAFAGVRKTIDGTEADFAELEQGIIDMSKELPASAVEIAGVAEAAGQLGVAKDNILDFAQTMIDLGETTNLSAEDAATMIAQFSNVTGAVEKYGAEAYQRLGSVIVALGNDGASTEAQIVSMGQRIAGAGAQVGLTDAQIMALASALASVGVEAEAGGSSMSTFLSDMNLAVSNGGKDLKKFAKVAGVSTDEFSKLFKEDAAGALELFVKGLGAAEDPLKTLTDMGIDEIRMRDALLRLAGAGDLLSDSFETANRAWDENTALSDEAAQRYKTMESVLALVKNNVIELARQIGDALAPYVMEAAKWVRKLTTFLQGLSPEVKEGAVKVGLLAAAIGPGMLAMSKLMKLMGGGAGFAKVFKLALSPVGLLAGGLFALYKLSPKVRAAFGKLTKFGKTFFKALSNGTNISDALGYSVAKVFGGEAYKKYKGFMDKMGKAWSSTVAWFKETGKGLSKAWGEGSADGGFFGGLASSAKYLVKTVGTLVMGALGTSLKGTSFDGFGKKLIEASLALKEGEKIDFSGLLSSFGDGLILWRDDTLIPWVESVDWQGMWDAFWETMLDLSKWLGEPTMFGAGVVFGYLLKLCWQIVGIMGQALKDALMGNPDGISDQELLDGIIGSPAGAAFTRLGENFWQGVYWAITGESISFSDMMDGMKQAFDEFLIDAYNLGKEFGVSFVNGMIEDINYVLGKMGIPLIPYIEFKPLETSDTPTGSWTAQEIVDYYEKHGDLGQGVAEVPLDVEPEFHIVDPETGGITLDDPLTVEASALLSLNIAPGGTYMVNGKKYTKEQLSGAFGLGGSNGGVSLFTAADKGGASAATNGSAMMQSGYQTGAMFSKGLANGITSGTSWIVAAATKAALAAKRAMNTALGIASPSKVAFASGAFFSEGFADGISSLRSSIARASAAIASTASKGLGYVPVSRRAPTMSRSASGGASVDMDRLAAIIAARPAVLRINDKTIARATVDANMAAQAERDARVSAGYGV